MSIGISIRSLPRWTFAVADTQYLLTFLVMLVTGLVISTLTARVQFQGESARRRERRTAALYAISRELAAGPRGHPAHNADSQRVAYLCSSVLLNLRFFARGNDFSQAAFRS